MPPIFNHKVFNNICARARVDTDAADVDASCLACAEFVELEVPAGEIIDIQLQSPLSSETAKVDDRVEARLIKDVKVGTKVAVAADSVTLAVTGGGGGGGPVASPPHDPINQPRAIAAIGR